MDVIHRLVRELEIVHQLSFQNWPESLVGYHSPLEESIDLFNFTAKLPLTGDDIFQTEDGIT